MVDRHLPTQVIVSKNRIPVFVKHRCWALPFLVPPVACGVSKRPDIAPTITCCVSIHTTTVTCGVKLRIARTMSLDRRLLAISFAFPSAAAVDQRTDIHRDRRWELTQMPLHTSRSHNFTCARLEIRADLHSHYIVSIQ